MSLKKLFYPESVAVIGASPNMGGGKMPFYRVLKNSGYQGPVYPVNPAHKEIDGEKVYSSIDDLPETPDLAIVQVPVRHAYATLEKAVEQGIRFVHFFTSGFSEIGDLELEAKMKQLLASSQTRVVGPNCLGVFCAESGVTFERAITRAVGSPGDIGFIGQSGGVTQNFLKYASSAGLKINKAVSCGNQVDLKVQDYIEFFADDENISVIAVYMEDVKQADSFFKVVRKAVQKKPIVILKGGSTDQGAVAAHSHTGALSGKHQVFNAALKQLGCMQVETIEQLGDICVLVTSYKIPRGKRIGFVGAGGGTSVLFTDAAARHGFVLPTLEEKTQSSIAKTISAVNTSTANPVDLGAFGLDFHITAHTIKALAGDANVDVVMAYFSMEFTIDSRGSDWLDAVDLIIEATGSVEKPVVPILDKFTYNNLAMEELRIKMYAAFREAGMSVFHKTEDAVYAMKKLIEWQRTKF